MNNKSAIVIGAGIIGLTSAYRLASAGYDVTVVDKNEKPAMGTSHANAGQLLYNFGAMGSPSFLRSLPGTILNPALHGVIAGGLCHPKNWPWALSFIAQCRKKAWLENSLKLIKLAQRSRDSLKTFKARHDFDFNWRQDGKIFIHPTPADLLAAEQAADFQRSHGGGHRVISQAECFEREPALIGGNRKIAGATYLPEAAVGNCHLFCEKLAELLTNKYNVQIEYNVKVDEIVRDQDRVTQLQTSKGIIKGDILIICGGPDSNKLLPADFPGKKPIVGVKGISLTYPLGQCPPDLSVTDAAGKFIIARLGDKIRITGYAIFSDNLDINQKHVELLIAKAKSLMPKAAHYDAKPIIWTGLRPQTPDDLPMIGRAGAENLYINAGHGSSGWILAFGSAEKLLEKIIE